jgi:hypothetical protein
VDGGDVVANLVIPDVFPKDDGTDYQRLFQAAQKGNQQAYEAVAVHLDLHPELWERIGDRAHRAQITWIETTAQGDLVSAEGIRRRMTTLRDELNGANASPVERLLVERILLCWLQVHHAEQQYAGLLQESHSTQRGDYFQKRIDRAHYRFLAAVRTLAVVRKFLRPPVLVGQATQVNVSEKAVNMVGTST